MRLILGEALIDLILEITPQTNDGRSMTFTPAAGGSSFNVAIGLSRLGKRVALVASISSDALGRYLEQQLEDEGVDIAFLTRTDAPTPLAIISIDGSGVPEYAFHGLRKTKIDVHAAALGLQHCTAIHLSSVSLVSPAADILLDGMADASGKLFSLDPNVRLAIEPDQSVWRRQIDLFRRHADIVKVSNEDLEAVFGTNCDVDQIAAGWLSERTRLVVLTKGSAGCRAFFGDGREITVPAARVTVTDTVGAGDTYMAAMLCWLEENGVSDGDGLGQMTALDVQAMACFAVEAAAVTCSRAGPDMAWRSELTSRPELLSGG